MAASAFTAVATPAEDIAEAVETRHREILESIVGQFAHADSVRAPQQYPDPPKVA